MKDGLDWYIPLTRMQVQEVGTKNSKWVEEFSDHTTTLPAACFSRCNYAVLDTGPAWLKLIIGYILEGGDTNLEDWR